MREWTTEERYRLLSREDLPELKALHERILQSRWRGRFHVQTVTGLMNDPNGFSYFNGKWHLFYQWFPYGPVHGMKHWYHVESKDLIHWENAGIAILPNTFHENKGAFSGSAFPTEDCLYLAYTGNNRDENWVRHPSQLLAKLDKDNNLTRIEEPIIPDLKEYSEHQRDPKLFYDEKSGYYWILLGVQTHDKKGEMALFRSKEIETGWEKMGALKVRGLDDFGFMAECPDLEPLGDKWLLLFSPQGLKEDGDNYRNLYNNVYYIGEMDFENLEFIPDGDFKELDHGLTSMRHSAQISRTAIKPIWSAGAVSVITNIRQPKKKDGSASRR